MSEIVPVVHAPLRAAVVGASGIGKHHAKWIEALGGQVVAIVGSSAVTAATTAQALQDQLGIKARPYHDLAEMLAEEDPDLVHVCTPPHLHYEHVMTVAPHRCHLMCEKPLTWDDAKSAHELMEEARQMVQASTRPGRIAAVNLQYTAVPAAYYAAVGEKPKHIDSFFMRLDSKRDRNVYDIIWRELSPHCLSVLTAFCGEGHVDYDTVELTMAERLCESRFIYNCASGDRCEAEIVVGCTLEGPLNRRFGVNGVIADYEGRNDEHGVFRTYLKLGDGEHVSDDFMYLSMRELLLAVVGRKPVESATGQAPRPLATLTEGLHNQEMQLQILARGRRV